MYRLTSRQAPRVCRASCGPATSPSSRAIFTSPPFFPYSNAGPWGAFANDALRLFDSVAAELAQPESSSSSKKGRHGRSGSRSFVPRFDVTEASNAYQLHGDLPGFEQKDLDIQFVDDQTLVVRGKTSHETTTSTNASGEKAVGDAATSKAVEAAPEQDADTTSTNYKRASVTEDDDAAEYVDAGAETSTADAPASSPPPAAAAAEGQVSTSTAPTSTTPQPPESTEPRYWLTERSTGEFERRFSFPGRVDQDSVTASLRNGILNIVVPKIVQAEARKIAIQ